MASDEAARFDVMPESAEADRLIVPLNLCIGQTFNEEERVLPATIW